MTALDPYVLYKPLGDGFTESLVKLGVGNDALRDVAPGSCDHSVAAHSVLPSVFSGGVGVPSCCGGRTGGEGHLLQPVYVLGHGAVGPAKLQLIGRDQRA